MLWKVMLATSEAVTACSAGLAGEAGRFHRQVTTVHNGIDTDAFLSTADSTFKLPDNFATRKIVLSVGLFRYRKGHDVLVNAFAEVAAHHPEALLVIVGSRGPYYGAIANLVNSLNLTEDVAFFTGVPHVRIPIFLSAASVFVMASRWQPGVMGEGFPMALLEAAAAGVPIVTTASCGASELIEDGATGRLTPLDDPGSLAKAICALLADTREGRRLAGNLRTVVRQRFTWERAFKAYKDLL
jgi:phosphatidylinositol alpha-1,6-mannosyltransferase